MPARAESTVERKQLGDSEEVLRVCGELEVELNELKAQYEQYFLGMERLPPTKHHDRFKKRVAELKGKFVRQTAVKFRVQQLVSKLGTYERLWDRSMKEIEAGTYSRDLYKARRHRKGRDGQKKSADGAAADDFAIDEDLDLSDLGDDDDLAGALAAASAAVAPPVAKPVTGTLPVVKPVTGTLPVVKPVSGDFPAVKPVSGGFPAVKPPDGPPAAGALPRVTAPVTGKLPAFKPGTTGTNPALKPVAGRPAPVAADGGLSEQKIKAIYDAYVMAKKRCGEDTRSVTLDAVSATLKKQVPELMKQHQAKSVEFKVVIKDGKAVLRALPKE